MVTQISAPNHDDELLNRIIKAIVAKVNFVLKVPLLNGVLTTAQVFAAGGTDIPHKLNRKPQGYIICGLSAPAAIYTVGNATDKTIPLQSSADCTATLWFF